MRALRSTTQIEVAVYKGDELICLGPIIECAKKIGCLPETLYWYTMPTYQRRISKRKRSNPAKVRQVVRI